MSDNRDWYNVKQVLYIVEFKLILLRNFPFRQYISKLLIMIWIFGENSFKNDKNDLSSTDNLFFVKLV